MDLPERKPSDGYDAPHVIFLQDESGATVMDTATDYGLIASGIAVAIIAVVKGVGSNLKGTFGSISSAVKYRPLSAGWRCHQVRSQALLYPSGSRPA